MPILPVYYDLDLTAFRNTSEADKAGVLTLLASVFSSATFADSTDMDAYSESKQTYQTLFDKTVSPFSGFQSLYIRDGLTALFQAYGNENATVDLAGGTWSGLAYEGGVLSADKTYTATLTGGVYQATTNATGWRKGAFGGISYADPNFKASGNGIELPVSLLSGDAYTVESVLRYSLRDIPETTKNYTVASSTANDDGTVTHTVKSVVMKTRSGANNVTVSFKGTANETFEVKFSYVDRYGSEQAETRSCTMGENGTLVQTFAVAGNLAYAESKNITVTLPEGVTIQNVAGPLVVEAAAWRAFCLGTLYGSVWTNLKGHNTWGDGYGTARWYHASSDWSVHAGSAKYPAFSTSFGDDKTVLKGASDSLRTLVATKVATTVEETTTTNFNVTFGNSILLNNKESTKLPTGGDGEFRLLTGLPGEIFAVRTYNRKLSEEEIAHNRAVDILLYVGFDYAKYARLSDSEKETFLSLVSARDFTATLKDIDGLYAGAFAPQALYVTDGLKALLLSYAGVSTADTENKTWQDLLSGKTVATLEGSWKKNDIGGLEYHLAGNSVSTGITLDPHAFLSSSYSVEIIGAVKGYTQNADGVTPVQTTSQYGIAASVPSFSFGPLKAFMFFGENNTTSGMELWDSAIRWMYSDGTMNWNDSGTAYGWGKTDKKLYFQNKAVTSFTLTLDLAEDNSKAVYNLYKNTALNSTYTYPSDKNTAVIGLDGTEFKLFRSTGSTAYGVRIYDRILTEAEMKQNHVADVLFFYDVDVSDYVLADQATQNKVFAYLLGELGDVALSEENYSTVQKTVRTKFNSAMQLFDNSSLYVTSGLTSLFTAYALKGSVIDMTDGRWYDSITGEYATLIGGENYWMRNKNSLSYSLVFDTWGANVGLSLPTSLLPDGSYTVEIAADVVGIREDNGGKTGSDATFNHAVDQSMAFGPLKVMQWTTPVDQASMAYPTKWYYKAGQDATFATATEQFTLDTVAFTPAMDGGRNLAVSMRTENGEATYSFWHNANLLGSVTAAVESAENDTFRLFYQMPAKVYAIRIYDRELTEAEQQQNHFADLVYYYGLEVGNLADLEDKAAIYAAMMDVSFDSTTAEAQMILDFHLGKEEDVKNATITYEGLSAKINGTSSGVRSLYTVNEALIRELEKKYYVVYGALMGIGDVTEEGAVTDYRLTRDLAVTGSFAEGYTAAVENAACVSVYGTNSPAYATEMFVTLNGKRGFAYTSVLSAENESGFWYDVGLVYAGFLALTDKTTGEQTVVYSYAEGTTFGKADSTYGKATSICEAATYFVNSFQGTNEEMYKYNSNANLRHIMTTCGIAITREVENEAARLASLKAELAAMMSENTQDYPVLIAGQDTPLTAGQKAIWLQYAPEFDPASYSAVKACYFYYPMHDDPTELLNTMTPAEMKEAGVLRVFAYIAVPENAEKGIVCVHGGGGHAYAAYAYEAYNHGFAAIAFDTEGYHASSTSGSANVADACGHKSKDAFGTAKEGIDQQWMYYAISDCAFANTILRSITASQNVGITGISWGGLTTSIASCYDARFAFAVPVYLSYFLGYGDNSAQFDAIANKFAADLWQAEDVLAGNTVPTLLLNSQKDLWADLNSTVNTYNAMRKTNQNVYMVIKPDLSHSQQAGAGPAEIYRFGDWVLSGYANEKSFFKTSEEVAKNLGGAYTVELTVPANLTSPKAVLYYTTAPITYGSGGVVDQTFYTVDLTLTYLREDENGNKVYSMPVTVPSDAYLYFISFYGESAYDKAITPAYGSSEVYHGKVYSSTSVVVMKGTSINAK